MNGNNFNKNSPTKTVKWTAPNCTDNTKKIPGRKILSFKQSGVAQAAPLLFLVECVDDYRNRCSYQSKF